MPINRANRAEITIAPATESRIGSPALIEKIAVAYAPTPINEIAAKETIPPIPRIT